MINENNNADTTYITTGEAGGNTFCIDHSIRGTSKCKHCKSIITKGCLRIGKHAWFKNKQILNFFHVKCAFNMFLKSRVVSNVVRNVDEIDGFNIITPEEQSLVKDYISHFLSNIPKKLPSGRATEITQPNRKPKSQYFRPKALSLPSIKIMFTNADQLTSTKIVELKNVIQIENPPLVAVSEVKLKKFKGSYYD